jgi:hypothetical protein
MEVKKMAYGENYIVFKISSDGKVLPVPDHSTISTSAEMQGVLEEIAPKVAAYFEELLRERRNKK